MQTSVLPSTHLAVFLSGQGNHPLWLKALLLFQVRELQTRLQSVQATGPSSPGRLTSTTRPVNPSTGELSTSSSSNDIPIAKVSFRDGADTSCYLEAPASLEHGAVQACGEPRWPKGLPPGSHTGLLRWGRRER